MDGETEADRKKLIECQLLKDTVRSIPALFHPNLAHLLTGGWTENPLLPSTIQPLQLTHEVRCGWWWHRMNVTMGTVVASMLLFIFSQGGSGSDPYFTDGQLRYRSPEHPGLHPRLGGTLV